MSYIAPFTNIQKTQAPSVSGFFANNYGTRTTQPATMRGGGPMPFHTSGNMSLNLKDPLIPTPPESPASPKVTEQPFDFYLNNERTRSGMLSTFFGRNLELPQNKMRRAGLSSYMNS